MTRPQRRTTDQVINQAIEENRFGERMLYGFAVAFVLVGLSVLGYGLRRGDHIEAITGCVASSLFFPAMSQARKIREQNMAIRLLEIPLSNSTTAQEASEVLRLFFESTFQKSPKAERTNV